MMGLNLRAFIFHRKNKKEWRQSAYRQTWFWVSQSHSRVSQSIPLYDYRKRILRGKLFFGFNSLIDDKSVFCRFYLTTRGQSTEKVVFNQTEANIDNPQLLRKVRVLELATNSEFALMCRSFRQVFKLHRKRVKVCKLSYLRIANLTILWKP